MKKTVKNKKIIDITKPIKINTYLSISILGKNLNLNVSYKNIILPEIDVGSKEVNIILPIRYEGKDNIEIISKILNRMYKEIAEREIQDSLEISRYILGFAPEDYFIQEIKNGFCKTIKKDQVIIINPNIVKYNRTIIDNTIIQAFCKLRYKEGTKAYIDNLKYAIREYDLYMKNNNNVNNIKFKAI